MGFLYPAVLLTAGSLAAQSFDPLGTTLTGPRDPVALAAGDFDGDMDLDIIAQSGPGFAVTWELYRNDGQGIFTAELLPMPPGLSLMAWDIAVADIDGDSSQDLIVSAVSFSATNGLIFRNNGQGSFQVTLMPHALFTTQMLPVDVDGDNDIDLVCTSHAQLGQSLLPSQLLLNDGTGSFTNATTTMMPNPPAARRSVAMLDVQGDGLVDVVFGGWPVFVLLKGATGTFTHVPGAIPTGCREIRALDVEGDGDQDLVGLLADTFVVLQNDGAGTFTPIHHALPGISAWRHADIDGDGDQDFLTATTNNLVQLWRQDPGVTLVDATQTHLPPLAPNQWVGTVNDVGIFLNVDGDLDTDLYTPAISSLLLNDGTGHFAHLDAGPRLTVERTAVATDIDGDGHVDLVGLATGPLNTQTRDLAWWQNDGLGQFRQAAVLGTMSLCDASKVVAFDMDGDGDSDIWALQCGTDRVWRNDGGGVLVEVTQGTFPLDTRTDIDVLVRDYDLDGDVDAFVPRDYLYDSLYINNGSGIFAEEGNTRLTDNELTLAAAALDFDRDGDSDLVLANATTTLRLFANDGAGQFTDVSSGHLPPLSGTYHHVLAADIDGDGDEDLVLTATNAYSVLLRNDAGTFVDASSQLPWVAAGYWPHAVDFDLDGDLDLQLGSNWLINDGQGNFTLSPEVLVIGDPTWHRTNVFADLDADDDPDILFGTIQRNLHGQLENAIPPRSGFHGELRLHGRSIQAGWPPLAFLYFSNQLASAPISLGPLGSLLLDPSQLALLSTHVVPAQPGYAQVRYLVPNHPAFGGVTIPVQALIAHGPAQAHTTNTIVLTVLH